MLGYRTNQILLLSACGMSGEKWIIDSNAFIHLGQKATASEIRSMMGVIRTMNQRLRITPGVRGEVARVRCQLLDKKPLLLTKLNAVIDETEIEDHQIQGLAENLGEKAAPQDVDISLMVLAADLGRSGQDTILVSDDFKMAKGAKTLALPYRTCPPSTFIQKLSRQAGKDAKKDLDNLARSIRSAEMRYTIQRAGTYNADAKLSWMINSLLEDDEPPETTTKEQVPSERKLVRALSHFIEGKKVKASHMERIQDLSSIVSPLKTPYQLAKSEPEYDSLDEALTEARIEVGMALAPLSEEKGDMIRKATSSVLWRLEAALGILALEAKEAKWARRHLAKALETAAIADDDDGEHHALMHLALIELGEENPSRAMTLFMAGEQEAKQDGSKIQASLGAAMAAWMSDNEEKAEECIEKVRAIIENNEGEAVEPLMTLGRSLRAVGFGVLALEVYDEALECAVESNRMKMANSIVSRMSEIDTSVSDAHQDRLKMMIDRINSIDGDQARLFEEKLAQLS